MKPRRSGLSFSPHATTSFVDSASALTFSLQNPYLPQLNEFEDDAGQAARLGEDLRQPSHDSGASDVNSAHPFLPLRHRLRDRIDLNSDVMQSQAMLLDPVADDAAGTPRRRISGRMWYSCSVPGMTTVHGTGRSSFSGGSRAVHMAKSVFSSLK